MKTVVATFALWLALTIACHAQVVDTDRQAFEFAQREANLQASREKVGHFLGIAPGCRFAGVGCSQSTSRPNHCSTTRYRLVARAFAIGPVTKRIYWSAQYR